MHAIVKFELPNADIVFGSLAAWTSAASSWRPPQARGERSKHNWLSNEPMSIISTKTQHLLAVLAILICLFAGEVRAADLTDPKNANILDQWGYLNVVAYGADPTGRRDSTKEIQKAIDDSTVQTKALLFPLGSYIISDTLRCYKWWNKGKWPFHAYLLVGENRDGKRPLIKLAAKAPRFDDGENPRPMLADAFFQGADSEWTEATDVIIPPVEEIAAANPMKGIKGFKLAPPNLFDDQLRNIDFDCSGHPGAVGVFFPSAQKCLMLNVDVNAEGAHTGIHGIPGRNSGAANISVRGGRFGLVLHSSEAGSTVVGLRLHGQTDRALVCNDFVPTCIVGFEIKKKTAPVVTIRDFKETASGTLALIDGTLEVEDRGLLIDNKAGKSVYVRNVYARGAGAFIASGNLPAVGGSGSWFRIAEYCYTDQRGPRTLPPKKNDNSFRVFNLINGQLSREAQPVATIENQSQAPMDYIKGHLYARLPQISFADSSKTINVTQAPYHAKPDGSDNWEKIQKAIQDGAKDGRPVYIPQGTFLISKPLELSSESTFFGLGCKRNAKALLTALAPHPAWKKDPDHLALIRTVDDPAAETHLSGMNLFTAAGFKQYVHWRAGRRSTIMDLGFHGFIAESTILFSGNGGGRHYLLEPQTPTGGPKEHCHVRMNKTSEPLSWYGCNLEFGNKQAVNLEMVDSSNIRIYGIKREGRSPTMILNDCRNVAIYAQGAMREGVERDSGGYVQVRGSNDGLLMPLILTQLAWSDPNDAPLLVEDLDARKKASVIWPESISLYKRGEIDDSRMYLAR